MTRGLGALVATVLAVLLVTPVFGSPDDDRAGLLDLRRATVEELADIGRQLDEVQARKVDPDWVIVRGDGGEYVQVSLQRIDELVPWVQMALADLDAAPTLLRAIARRDPELAKAADAAASDGFAGMVGSLVASEFLDAGPELDIYKKLKTGDIESIDSDVIRGLIRDFFAGASAQQGKADRYQAFEAELIEQRKALQRLLEVLDAALGGEDATGPDEPDECSEADMWCDAEDTGEIEMDALKGLTKCANDDAACEESDATAVAEDGLPPTEIEQTDDDQGSSTDFYLGDWQTDIGVLRIEEVGGRLAGTLTSDAGVAQVDVVEADERGLTADFYGPIDAPWTVGFAQEADECPEARNGTKNWGLLTMNPFGDDGFRGVWAPCDGEWRRMRHLYGEAWTNKISGTRITDDAGPASGAEIEDWSGIWSTDFGELELRVSRAHVLASFGEDASGDFRWAWTGALRRQDGDPGTIAGRWKGEHGTQACDERLEGVDYWGGLWLQLDSSGSSFTGRFDRCGGPDGGSIDGHKVGELDA